MPSLRPLTRQAIVMHTITGVPLYLNLVMEAVGYYPLHMMWDKAVAESLT